MVRAAVIHAFGDAPVVEEFADPQGREGLLVADVLAAALNPVDLRIATGTFYGERPDPPYVIGREAGHAERGAHGVAHAVGKRDRLFRVRERPLCGRPVRRLSIHSIGIPAYGIRNRATPLTASGFTGA